MSDESKERIDQQILFAIEYVKDFNGTRAAERAKYTGTDTVLAITASKLLRLSKVQNKIKELLAATQMQADELLWRFAQEARLDISDFVTQKNGSFELNWTNVRKYGYLIKSITHTKYGPKIELHDSQKARELIGKHLGLWTDKLDVTSGGQSLDEALAKLLSKSYGDDRD